jgi:glutathione S-transferase
MQVFGGLISPYVRKVCLVAAEKALEFELVLTNPGSTAPEFAAASPFGKIPAIRDGDFTLADSTAIALYLDAEHPEIPMLPSEPQARGRAMWFDEFADTILAGAGLKILFNRFVSPKFLKQPGDEAAAAQGEAELPAIFAYLESVAPRQGWLAGESFTLGDLAVASVLRTLVYVGMDPKPEAYPAITAWYERVRARPAWQQIAAIEDAPRRK